MNESEKQLPRTVDTILEWFEDAVINHKVFPPHWWIEGAQRLVTLMGNETDALYLMQQGLAKEKVRMLESEDGRNVSAVKLQIEATDEWLAMMQQSAKIKRIEEFVRLAKIRARLQSEESRHQM